MTVRSERTLLKLGFAPTALVAACAKLADQMLPVFSRSHPKMMDSNTALTAKMGNPEYGLSGKA